MNKHNYYVLWHYITDDKENKSSDGYKDKDPIIIKGVGCLQEAVARVVERLLIEGHTNISIDTCDNGTIIVHSIEYGRIMPYHSFIIS